MKRRDTREEAVKIAYSMDINKDFDKELPEKYIAHFELDDTDVEYLNKTLSDMIDHVEEIDNYIIENSKGWKIGRIAKVDLAIMRIALAEVLYNGDIPQSVSINEAVEISKKYSSDDSHKYINGILGTIVRAITE